MMKTKCVSNPYNYPYLTIGNSYEILCEHPTNEDYFCLKADYNVSSYYNKSWFESISDIRDLKINNILEGLEN